jgi:Protein of unknown function (DUF3575)
VKNTIALTLILLLATSVFSQKNCAKGRIIGLPGNTTLFSMGIGYERMVADFWSVQVLINRHGWDMRSTDGQAEFTNAVVPEMRYYFGKYRRETLNKASFLAFFLEGALTKTYPGGETIGPVPPLDGKSTSLSPGLLLGKNAQLSKLFYFEFYAGAKYRFVHETDYYILDDLTEITEEKNFEKLAPRLGLNLGFRF